MRPALVIQNDVGNRRAPTVIVAAVSTTHRAMPQHVLIEPEDVTRVSTQDRGLSRPSEVKAHQILTISKERLRARMGLLSEARMNEVDRALRLSLSL